MIPNYQKIMLPFLKCLSDGQIHILSDLYDSLVNNFNLTEEENRELLPSGRQGLFRNRVGWTRAYLKKSGLVDSPKRAHFVITERGLDLLKENPKEITNKLLMRYPEFVDFITPVKKESASSVDDLDVSVNNATPEEVLEFTHQKLKSELSKELISIIKGSSPEFFEKLVIDLLLAMGYGGSRKDAGRAMGKSGDGGIDGIIKEDKLGLDTIYIQAKRWENTVPVKEIRDFAGALLSKKAKKGIFIATSSFPKSAYEFVDNIEHKIVLINGDELTDLMIDNNVGLATQNKYEVKKVDFDYFEES